MKNTQRKLIIQMEKWTFCENQHVSAVADNDRRKKWRQREKESVM